ncbi:hypothetical protein GC173_17275 [bacterium]|nr:hypothetical protein [bacterium]
MHLVLAVVLLLVALLLIAKPGLFASEGEPDAPSFSLYILFGMVLYALQMALYQMSLPVQRAVYRVLGCICLIGAMALGAFGQHLSLEVGSRGPRGVSFSAGSASYTQDVVKAVQKERPNYIVWESAIKRVEVIDPDRKLAVSYSMVSYANDRVDPQDAARAVLFDVDKDLNARSSFLSSSGEMAAKQAEVAKVIERNNLKAPGAKPPAPAPQALPEAPPRMSEQDALNEVAACLARADVAWKSGDKSTSLLEANTAMGICRMHLGEDHPRTKQVAAMVSAAARK